MAAFKHTARKRGRLHRHVIHLRAKEPEIKRLAPMLARDLAALNRKFTRLVKQAKAAAERRKAREG